METADRIINKLNERILEYLDDKELSKIIDKTKLPRWTKTDTLFVKQLLAGYYKLALTKCHKIDSDEDNSYTVGAMTRHDGF